ncbi:MAG: hypothetical protein K8R52_03205 [Bacteroidales bacterium]|nr:hypothetical protein [Bacteroidales bacterium]
MKIVSRNLLLYALLLLIYTVVFRFGLSRLLTAEKWIWVIIIAVAYGALIFVTAWMTGKRDGMNNFLFDAGFRWNLTTFIVWGAASEAWFLLGLHSVHESIRVVHITLLFWTGFLILHLFLFLILRRRTIKGVHKTNIFE